MRVGPGRLERNQNCNQEEPGRLLPYLSAITASDTSVLNAIRLGELVAAVQGEGRRPRGRCGGKHKDPDREPRRRRRATYNRYGGVRHLFAALDLTRDRLYGHIKPIKRRTQFLEFCRYLRTLYPPEVRIAIVCDNFSPHLTTKKCQRVGTWAAANNVEIAYTPTNSSWLNRIEAQFTALRYFTLDGTDHADHEEQGSMIRRYIIWRNLHADDRPLRALVDRANVA